MRMNFSVPVVALILGAAAGFVLAPSGKSEAPEAEKAEVESAAIADRGEEASIEALRARIRDLEAKLAKSNEKVEEAKVAENAAEARRFTPPSGEEMKKHFEEWKKENPEEFAKLEQRMLEMGRRRMQRTSDALDFFKSIDTASMSEEEAANHTALVDLYNRRQEMQAKLMDTSLSDDERFKTLQELMSTEGELRELRGKERQSLMTQLAGDLGFTGDNAAEFTQMVGEIYSFTEGERGFHFQGGGPNGPGGMPPPPMMNR